MSPSKLIKLIVLTCLMALLTACGGGGGGTGAAAPGGAAISSGVMVKGSVIVNGVRYEDTTANIVIDDTPKTAAHLHDGMVVQVSGTVSDDGVNGKAERVEAQIEVRGRVDLKETVNGTQRFRVLGQMVIVDDQTIYSNLPGGFAAIVGDPTTGTIVEVHGQRDADSNIRATRVEGSVDPVPADNTGMTNGTIDEIRGVVTGGAAGNNPTSFNIGSQAIAVINAATITPANATYQNGSIVEVHCTRPCLVGGVFQADLVEVESAEDSAFQSSQNQRREAEGLVSGYTPGATAFFVDGIPVTISGSTRYVGGISTDLKDNIKVEAEGVWTGTAIAASKIEYKRSVVRLQGVPSASGGTFTLNVAGNNVSIESDNYTQGSVNNPLPACVQVRGQRKAGGGTVVTAGEIINSCSNSNRPVMQAPVEAKTPEVTVTLLGFAINVSAPLDTPPYKDINDQSISRTAFFNAVTPANPGPPAVAGTLVKVIFDENSFAVRQAELED